jgi:hypothetical protein
MEAPEGKGLVPLSGWHRKIAWLPVKTWDGKWCWLTYVERRLMLDRGFDIDDFDIIWQYRV